MKKNPVLQLWVVIVLIAIILIFAVCNYTNNLTANFEREVVSTMEEVSAQGVVSIKTEINGKKNLLEDLAMVIEVDLNASEEELVQSIRGQLESIVAAEGFRGMGIMLADGSVYSTVDATTKENYNAGNQEFFQKALNGETSISGRISMQDGSGEHANLYTTPILDKETNEPIAVLFATYQTENFRSTIEVTSFHGAGYSYVIEADGDVVVDSAHESSFQNMTNVYTSLEEADADNKEAIQRIQQYIADNESGRVVINNKVEKYFYCCPIGVNDWYLITVVPVTVMDNQMNMVIQNTILLVVILAAVFIALILLIMNQQKHKQKELATLAYVDAVTGGYTFAKFQQEYAETMQNHSNQKYAFVFMDLNKFKMINDLYGYDEGNRIIRNIEQLWQKHLSGNEFCGHRMADRFVILLNYSSEEEVKQRLQEYRLELQETTRNRYKLNLRMGVYVIEDTSQLFSTVYNRAMMAFAAAKNSKSQFMAFYHADMEEEMIWEKSVEDDFQTALKNHEFVVFYQAKIDAETGKVSGAEALVRWIRRDGTIVPPNRFIPVLENNGTIIELDRYMFREVCLRQKAWLDEGKPIVPVSVNLSRVQLAESGFVSAYQEILEETGLPSEYVGLEFTESAMFDNEEILRNTVERLHNLGVKVLVDDFGVGYSSMMSLKAIPVDILKVDKCFIDSIGDERGDKIVISIIEFALSLGMSVTAEGVENDYQYRFLRAHRCNDIQGYYFSKPVPANEYCQRFLESA